MVSKAFFEFVEEAGKIRDENERIEYARKNWSHTIAYMFYFAYDSRVQWKIPKGTPPFQVTDYLPESYNALNQAVSKMYIFMTGYPSQDISKIYPQNMSQIQREQLFISLLETLHPKDAALLIRAKDGLVMGNGLDEAFIRKAYPDLLSGTAKKSDVSSEKDETETPDFVPAQDTQEISQQLQEPKVVVNKPKRVPAKKKSG